MGTNTISAVTDGSTASASGLNQYRTALNGNLVPRNDGGAPTDIFGDLGESTFRWLRAEIASGYWDIGDIKPHHSYNGAAPIGEGWFPCLGSIINETNYDAIFGTGHWDTYVISSALDGKYAPDLTDKYLVGTASTSQDGTIALTSTGNLSNEIDTAHNHKWYDNIPLNNVSDNTYNSAGDSTPLLASGGKISGVSVPSSDGAVASLNDAWTSTGGSTTQSIQPESIEVIYYIRLI